MDLQKFSTSRIDYLRNIAMDGIWPKYFHGLSGRGKSFAAALIYSEWPLRTFRTPGATKWLNGERVPDDDVQELTTNYCQWWTCGELYPIMAGFDNQCALVRQKCEECDLIVLDDIADRNMTDARRASLLDILNWRGSKPLIMTGNYDAKAPAAKTAHEQENLKQALKDDRLVGRVMRCFHLRFAGPDMRLANLKSADVPI